jgi:hypothetical protein
VIQEEAKVKNFDFFVFRVFNKKIKVKDDLSLTSLPFFIAFINISESIA